MTLHLIPLDDATLANSVDRERYVNPTQEIARLRKALTEIRAITVETHRARPYTALSQIDQIARWVLA